MEHNSPSYIKYFAAGFGAAFLFLSTGCSRSHEAGNDTSPNVILILADDMAYGDLSIVNEGMSHTPNLDRLAKESVWFNQGYSAAPVCAPARAALLTGKYPHQTGCITLGMKRFPELTRMDSSLITIADIFRQNGYTTGMIGKWHCGVGQGYHPMERGFEEFEGFSEIHSYSNYELDINGTYESFNNQYLTQNLSDRAVAFVRRHKDEPFFLHLAHLAPHRPLEAPSEIIDQYLDKGFDQNTAIIYAMIEVMDKGIGRLMEELNTLGIRENTLIIFASDNGPDLITGPRYNQGLRGTKYTVYEGGIHVPYFISWKDSIDPGTRDEVVHFTDIFPTLVELCGLKTTKSLNLEGGSLARLLAGSKEFQLPIRRFWQWNRAVPWYSHNAAMREGRWKLVRPFVTTGIPEGPSELKPVLYDLKEDPFETKDVSDQYPARYENMCVILEEWCREVEFRRMQLNNKL